jgi:hypothetical protein
MATVNIVNNPTQYFPSEGRSNEGDDMSLDIKDQCIKTLLSSEDEWEYVSNDDGSSSSSKTSASKIIKASEEEKKEEEVTISIIHRCESTPVFSNSSFEDDFSYVLDCDASSVDAQSIMSSMDDTILVSQKNVWGGGSSSMKKIPSFKDILASNMQELEKEEQKKQELQKEMEEKRRVDSVQRRKTTNTRFVVTPIKRCARSTGDLRSMTIHEEEEGIGGGGGGPSVIHEHEEVVGDTDASEYYDRKSAGSKGRRKGLKSRPDEKKRKEHIIYKKNAQRRAQESK